MHSISTNPALTIALALAAGVLAQAIARHLRLPGIVLLLMVGVALGPDGLKIIHPESLGHALHILVGFAVAVILFEGGLTLDIEHLRRAHRPVRQLVTLGALVTALGATLAVRFAMAWDWRSSVLFGSLVIVTGPTVVTPLLRRIRVRASVATVLEAEGVLIDAIGAVFAAVALEVALSPSGESILMGAGHIALRLGFGVATGALGGLLFLLLLRDQDLIPDGLENIFVLSFVLALFQTANTILEESGIAAVTVAGMIVGNMRSSVRRNIAEFKEQLTVMLIGMLFVLLAADVRLSDVRALGVPALITVAILIFLVRPANVFVGTWRTGLALREKLFISWIGPRGIVAAAVASLFAGELKVRGLNGGDELRAMVFLVIAITVILCGATGGLVARVLGLKETPRGWVILGAHALSRALAKLLAEGEEEVVLVDSNREACVLARREGLSVVEGNILEERVIEQLRVDSRRSVVGLSTNEEVNLLFVQRVKRRSTVDLFYSALRTQDSGVTPAMIHELGAEVLFGGPEDVALWATRLRRESAHIVRFVLPKIDKEKEESNLSALAPPSDGLYLPLALHRTGNKVWPVGDQPRSLQSGDQVSFAILSDFESKAEAELARSGWRRCDERAAQQTR